MSPWYSAKYVLWEFLFSTILLVIGGYLIPFYYEIGVVLIGIGAFLGIRVLNNHSIELQVHKEQIIYAESKLGRAIIDLELTKNAIEAASKKMEETKKELEETKKKTFSFISSARNFKPLEDMINEHKEELKKQKKDFEGKIKELERFKDELERALRYR